MADPALFLNRLAQQVLQPVGRSLQPPESQDQLVIRRLLRRRDPRPSAHKVTSPSSVRPSNPPRQPTSGTSSTLARRRLNTTCSWNDGRGRGSGRAATRGSGEVIELECGATVYSARSGEAGGGQSGTRTGSGGSARRRLSRN